MIKLSSEGKLIVIGDRQSANLFKLAGITIIDANNQKEAEEGLKKAKEKGGTLAIILKHIVDDEASLRNLANSLNITLLILPTKWVKAEPINIDKLLAKALGMG
ncbi:archaeal/vacuolar-type H+-ATPase subunit F [Caldisphaera lagunensis DSM 15908]|uniref:Archaeal/vacuolar-type H+-ATPase subunit F n=1 Tax=Caldisphaera lagunensis (strain DSM 15908 / JCM 11604 / ANMR 0165 / IC-154) TaxID=1056495 RepID=L0ACZ4_CALLD|nr:archaeal/vacuolar-type H+-ATPase subunit F [Caldisphaera lagunensis DSM 15908]